MELGRRLIADGDRHTEELYINMMRDHIRGSIEAKGYAVHRIEIEIETYDAVNYGRINQLILYITEDTGARNLNQDQNEQTEIRINEVEEVNVNNREPILVDEYEKLDEEIIDSIKDYLVNTYGVVREGIHINQRGI